MHERPFSLDPAPGCRLRGNILDFGTEPVGVFLHGFRSDSRGEKAESLLRHAKSRRYSWVRFDFSGHGRSDGVLSEFSITDALRDVSAVLEMFAPRPAILVGSSLGGWLAELAAQRTPDRVKAMLLIAPAFNFMQNFLAGLDTGKLNRWRRDGIQDFTDP